MNCEAESINNFKFLIELSITQFSEFFNFKFLKNWLALAANSLQMKRRQSVLIADWRHEYGAHPILLLLGETKFRGFVDELGDALDICFRAEQI
jgi:hypothetical protein